ADTAIDYFAAQIATTIDIDRVLGLARRSALGRAPAVTPIPPLGRRMAVAWDRGFCFAYSAVLEGWRRQGVELYFFSPLANEAPAGGADAIYLPGGYPELWTERLASAERFLAGLRQAAADGKTIYGECGGYMVLGDVLVGGDGRCHRMAGLLPLATSFAERRR